jgi:hypothetical protein
MAAAKTVRLRHNYREGDWVFYYYEGEAPVVDGVLAIPADRPEWAKRAYVMGFRKDVDGEPITDLDAHVARELARK